MSDVERRGFRMPENGTPRDFRRARSAAQKEERRRDVLDAARVHLGEVGIDAFSMVPLSKATGVARGTLYLYFKTREEVLLALYLEETRAWLDELEQITRPAMAVDDFLRAVFTSATRRTIFMELAPRVTGVIENNVSIDRLGESKRLAVELLDVAGRRTALALGFRDAQGLQVATGLFALLLGVTQVHRVPEVEVESLPPDLRQLLAGAEPIDVFLRAGRWLVDGALHSAPSGVGGG